MKAFVVYGPPGTGKSTEMLSRVADAAKIHGAHRVGFVSFTRAAANVALSRMGIEKSDVVNTIHGLCYRLIGFNSPQVVDWRKLNSFSERIGIPISGGSVGDMTEVMIGDEYLSLINYSRATYSDKQEVWHESHRPGTLPQFLAFCEDYDSWRKHNGYVDFSDMLERYNDKPLPTDIKVLMVDEAQDLSPLQWQVIENMIVSSDVEEVHIASDDDQACFEWSGADAHGTAKFEKEYKAERLILPQSYRIPRSVHRIANDAISRVKNRVQKEYRARDEEGVVNRLNSFDVADLATMGDDIMMLCRVNSILRDYEKELVRARVPYTLTGRNKGLFYSSYAEAIRKVLSFKNGESIDLKSIDKCLSVGAKKAADRKDMEFFTHQEIPDIVEVPWYASDYLYNINLLQKPSVRLSTIHSAKGTEADTVVLDTSLTSRIWESMSIDPDPEWRVLYVGLTRAKHRLDLVQGNMGIEI